MPVLPRARRPGALGSRVPLSRSRDHGLRPEQSHLFLAPQPDGTVTVEGLIAGEPVRLGPQPATLTGSLRDAIDRLAQVPVE